MSAQPELPCAQASRPVRLAFVGLGWIGRKRLDAAAAAGGIEVAALADAAPERVASAAEQYPSALVASHIDELLSRELDGVVIATPNGCHAEQALACLERGVPVFCQKPLAIDGTQTARVIAAAQAADCLLGVDFCYRHVQGMGELRRRVAAGDLGRILSIDLEFHNAFGPDKAWCRDRRLAGGGCVLDLGVHLLDLALWLNCAPQMRLAGAHLYERGRLLSNRDHAIEDLAWIELYEPAGATVRIACSWHSHIGQGASISMRLLGTAGGAYWRNVDGSFYDFRLDLTRADSTECIGAPPDDWGCRALRSWASRLQRDRSFDPDILLAARGSALIDQVYRT